MNRRTRSGTKPPRRAAVALTAALSIIAVVHSGVTATAGDREELFVPVEELARGDRCVGRTVFSGTEVEEFDLEIVGVIRGAAPGTDLIIGRAEGALLEETGILEGMSGSPVYKDGRLIGAVASTWQFSKQPIAGITPIGEMLPALDFIDRDDGSSAAGGIEPRAGVTMIPAEERRLSSLARIAEEVGLLAGASEPVEEPPGVEFGDRRLTPITAPLVVAGASEEYLLATSRVLGSGVAPMRGAGSSTQAAAAQAGSGSDAPSPEPGSAIGVQFVRGDVNWTAIGTVTYREGDRVLAFGHPLFNSGSLEMPMVAAYVHALMPLQSVSFKYATGGELLGTLTQDRNRAVAGVVGPEPAMIPVAASVTTDGGPASDFSFEVVKGRPYSAIFSGLALGGAVSSAAKRAGPVTVELSARVSTDAHVVEYRDLFHTSQPSMRCAGEVTLLLSVLLENRFSEVELTDVDIDVVIREGELWTAIERVDAERKIYRPGDDVLLRVLLRPGRGEPYERELSLRVPESQPDGPLTVRVGDAMSFHMWEQDRLGPGGSPRSYEQLLRLIERSKPGNVVVAQMLSDAPGFSLSGEEMRGVPGRAGLAMMASATSGAVDQAAQSLLSEGEFEVTSQAVGFHELAIQVSGDR